MLQTDLRSIFLTDKSKGVSVEKELSFHICYVDIKNHTLEKINPRSRDLSSFQKYKTVLDREYTLF